MNKLTIFTDSCSDLTKEEILKIAPGISIVSKGIILDEGEKVTVDNFANEKVFERDFNITGFCTDCGGKRM